MFAFDAANSTLTSEVANFDSTHAELSDDGTVLAAMNDAYTVNYPSQSVDLHVYALPQFALIHAWPGTSVNSTSPSDFRLARTGTRISRVVGHYDPSLCTRYVTDLAGATESFHDAGHCPTPRLSPSGSYIAVTDTERSPQSTTQIYHDSTLVNAVPGTAVVWFDDNTLLVQSYVVSTIAGSSYDHSTLYDHQGAMIATPVMLPRAVTDFYAISSNEIFDPTSSKIYDPATGTVIWNKGIEGGAAVAGPFVVYTARSGVFLTPH
jgi:hypothetical protein